MFPDGSHLAEPGNDELADKLGLSRVTSEPMYDLITIATTNFEQVADRTGDIVAFLQGYSNTWDELAGHTPAAQHHIDDIGYTAAVLAALSPLVGYNTSRVAVTGLSNGALMVETLGCRLASKIRLIVPVEGELASAVSPSCAPSRPINVLEIHGTADPSIPYNGGVFIGVGGAVSVLSARATVARWAHLGPLRDRARHHAGPWNHADSLCPLPLWRLGNPSYHRRRRARLGVQYR